MAQPIGPQVGDVIVFGRTPHTAMVPNVRLLVHRPHEFACVLDLAILGQGPGSLIVEEAAPRGARSVRLHWAGRRTSSDAADCGASADLIVDRGEMQLLARLGQP